MKIMKEKKNELRSLNEELPAFYLDELEQRLETDPLAIVALLNMDSSDSSDECICICNGKCKQYCSEYCQEFDL